MRNRVARDAFRFGLYTGMRRDEVLGLRWAQVDMNAMTFRVEETGTGKPLELPVTRQAGAILERRLAAVAFPGSAGCGCVRPRAAPRAVSAGCST